MANKIVDGVVIPLTAEEEDERAAKEAAYAAGANDRAAAEIRTKRDSKLIESDWTQMPDYTSETKESWAIYRQALRDITTHTNFPNLEDADWPVKPS